MGKPHDNANIMIKALCTERNWPSSESWVVSDGPGPSLEIEKNAFPRGRAAASWKTCQAVWMGRPPANTKLSDAWVFLVCQRESNATRGKLWPFDFNKKGHIRAERIPIGPAVHIMINGEAFFPIYRDYYVLHGSPPSNQKQWLCGDTTHHPSNSPDFTAGRARVPANLRNAPCILYNSCPPSCVVDTEGQISIMPSRVTWGSNVVLTVKKPEDVTRRMTITATDTSSTLEYVAPAPDVQSVVPPQDVQNVTSDQDVSAGSVSRPGNNEATEKPPASGGESLTRRTSRYEERLERIYEKATRSPQQAWRDALSDMQNTAVDAQCRHHSRINALLDFVSRCNPSTELRTMATNAIKEVGADGPYLQFTFYATRMADMNTVDKEWLDELIDDGFTRVEKHIAKEG